MVGVRHDRFDRIAIQKEPGNVRPDACDAFDLRETGASELDEEMLFVATATLAQRVNNAAQEYRVERLFNATFVSVSEEPCNQLVDRIGFREHDRVRNCATGVG